MHNVDSVMSQQQLDFSRILELSDLMFKGAEDEQWDSVTQLQLLREELIHSFFDDDMEMDNQSVSLGIKYMLDCDKKLAKLAKKEKSSINAQIKKMKQGKSAVKAYAS